MTNGDAVRNMTDYELAHFMTAIAKLSAEKLCESIKTIRIDLSECKWERFTESNINWLMTEAKK